jgi:hypothetical protein
LYLATRYATRLMGYFVTEQRTSRELMAWSKLDHKHVLDFLGLAQFKGRLAMISPWMEYGNVITAVNRWPKMDRYLLVS